jgi:hypothetical protein
VSYRAFLTDPHAFFSDQQEAPNRLAVLLILVGSGLIPLIAQLALTSAVVLETGNDLTLSYVVGQETTSVALSSLLSSLVSFASAIFYWFVATAGAYLLTIPFSDSGDPRRTLWLIGWGFVPPLLSGTVWLGAMIVSIQSTPTPETVAASAEFVRSVQQTQLVQATRMLDYLAIAWAGGLWTVGIRVIRNVTWLQAALAAVPGIAIQLAPYLLL